VIELTQIGQPHLHVVATGVDGKASALESEAREAWYAVTGDSYIVDVRPIRSVYGIGWYLGKYLLKGFHDREEMVQLGFIRRWSASRNWPRVGKLALATREGERLDAVYLQGYESKKSIARLGLESEYEAMARYSSENVRGSGDRIRVEMATP